MGVGPANEEFCWEEVWVGEGVGLAGGEVRERELERERDRERNIISAFFFF